MPCKHRRFMGRTQAYRVIRGEAPAQKSSGCGWCASKGQPPAGSRHCWSLLMSLIDATSNVSPPASGEVGMRCMWMMN